ncbi:MAG: AAA family ATPase [Sphingobium sp.]
MNEHTPIRKRGSLLERASEQFDFRKAIEQTAPVLPKDFVARPAPMPVSEPLAAPVFAPVAPAVIADAPIKVAPQSLVASEVDPVLPPERPVAAPSAPRAFTGRYGRVDRDLLREAGLIVPDAPASELSEEFRIVKRQLLTEAMGGESGRPLPRGRMILVCSAQPNDGKTFCALNLALSMAAEKDLEVLLIDGDFAKPEIISTLGLEPGPGLLDALADPSLSVETCVIRTDIPGLSVLPAGRHTHSDTELLAAAHGRAVLQGLLDVNPSRIVIFDSPPVLAASPASVLALTVGQALVVVKADKTGEAELRDAIGLLSGCENIQLLLNATTYASGGRNFGSYYGYGD